MTLEQAAHDMAAIIEAQLWRAFQERKTQWLHASGPDRARYRQYTRLALAEFNRQHEQRLALHGAWMRAEMAMAADVAAAEARFSKEAA